jgi:hypothetical protein
MLPTTTPRAKAAKLFSAIICLVSIGLLAAYALDRISWGRNYNDAPPAIVFQHVLGKPVLKGVSRLQVTGRAYRGKHWVWVTFQATDQALATLTQDAAPVTPDSPTYSYWIERSYAAHPRYNQEDKAKVRWREPITIPAKDVFQISGFGDGWGWGGYMVVDRQNHTVYVHAGDL